MADISGYLKIISGASSGEAVRDAIVNCMRAINADAAVKVTSLLITKADNVTYKAGVGQAYKNVTVNISGSGESDPEKTYNFATCTVTEETESPRTITPQDLGYDENTYFDKVDVNINWESITRPSNLGEEATMDHVLTDSTTGKKYWDASEAHYDYVKRIWIATDVGNLPDTPGDKPAGAYVTATFYDKDKKTVLQKQTVISGNKPIFDTRVCPEPTGTGTLVWSPSGVITRDTDIYPTFVSSMISDEDISESDDWDIVVKNELSSNGTAYPIGAKKLMEIDTKIPHSAENKIFPGMHGSDSGEETYRRTFYCLKVAVGENGTHSSWLCVPDGDDIPSRVYQYPNQHSDYDKFRWESSKNVYRLWLNNIFLNYCIDSDVKPYVLPKRTYFIRGYSGGSATSGSTDSNIWFPCAKEVYIDGVTVASISNLKAGYVDTNYYAYSYLESLHYDNTKLMNFLTMNHIYSSGDRPGWLTDRNAFNPMALSNELMFRWNSTNNNASIVAVTDFSYKALIGFCI